METLSQDIRFAWRSLRRSAGFTAVAVLALALGIGANTAIFSVVDGVLLRPLPYAEPERVVMIWNHWEGWPATWLSEPEVADYRTLSRSFERVGAFTTGGRNLTGGDAPERVRAGFITADVFPVLGVGAARGRVFGPEEDRPGGARVAVLSHGLWQRRFGGDPGVIGRTIQLNDSSVTVLGVMPEGFQLPLDLGGQPMDLWLPLQLDTPDPNNRGSHYLYGIARLKAGVSLEAAQREFAAAVRRMLEANPDSYSKAFGATLVPVGEQVLGDVRTPILVLLGAVGFVLLIACANVANLLLARSEARQREVAVRTALGAGRGRIVRQLLTESVVLALLGGVGGLLLAYWGVSALVAAAPASVPRAAEVGVDGGVLAFTLLVSLGTGLLFGTVPALHATRADLHGMLKDGGRGSTADAGRQRFRRAMVVTEIALALVLVVGAGLLIQSFARLRGVDAGFDPEGVLTMQLALPPSTYAEKGAVWAFYRQATERVGALPGVKAAGAVRALPMTGPIGDWGLRVEGRPAPGPHEEGIAGDWQVVTPDYFRTMGIRLVRGRTLTDADDGRAVPAILVNEELARRAWPGGDAVGRRLMLGGSVDSVWRTVVGVVGNVRQQGLDAEIRPEIYLPHAQWPAGNLGAGQRNMSLVVRGGGDVTALAGAIRREIGRLDPNLPVSDVRTMTAVVGSWAAERRLTTLVLGAFALVALALAAVGIYAVMAYAVVRRTHEIGIRMALGAAERDVLGMVVRQGVALALVGVALGLVAALALTRLMSSMLYEVSATDPATFAGLALLLAAVALLASYVPARRATRVDPMVALRSE